jgi:hypothetical protein
VTKGHLKKYPERPRASAKPIKKAPTHLLFFLLFFPTCFFLLHFQALLSKWSSKTPHFLSRFVAGLTSPKHDFFPQKFHVGLSKKKLLFFLPRFFDRFFYCVFGRVVTRGVKKIAETFSQPPKKQSLTYIIFVFTAPLGAVYRVRCTKPRGF